MRKNIVYILLVLTLATGYGGDFIKAAEASVSVIPTNIRIGLQREITEIKFSVQGAYTILRGNNGELITMAEPGKIYTLQRIEHHLGSPLIGVTCDGEQIATFTGSIVLEQVNREVSILSGNGALAKKASGLGLSAIDSSGATTMLSKDIANYSVLTSEGVSNLKVDDKLPLVTLHNQGGSKRYRGNFDFRLDSKGITVINYLPLEEYLYSVVSSEMYADWPTEALKAQAVVARTYALYSNGQYLAQGFDIPANQQSQVYLGYDQETSTTIKAVDETRGQVLTYRGQLILATFHSSSGGYTGNCGDIWHEDVPYLKAKKDPYDINNQHYNWSVNLSAPQLVALLTAQNIFYSQVLDMEVERDQTGSRVKKLFIKGLDVAGEYKETIISNADQVRFLLGLKSSLFTMEKVFDEEDNLISLTIKGNGNGHGIGMSQYGARGMAIEGYNCQDILQYYYTGVKLESNYGM
ncbi:SpoIID/LytB domain-containing protein [Peptococcaceae bacterium 1198_IL3148]